MTKLRNRLLISLVLVALMLPALGVGLAHARFSGQRYPTPTAPSAGYSGSGAFGCGEPDNSNNGAPPPKMTTASSIGHVGTSWFVQLWLQWAWKDSRVKAPRAR